MSKCEMCGSEINPLDDIFFVALLNIEQIFLEQDYAKLTDSQIVVKVMKILDKLLADSLHRYEKERDE